MARHHQNLEDDQIPQFDNSGRRKLIVPGFGCKLETVLPVSKRFRHGITDASYDRLTVKELAMLRLMDAITDKPNWKMKVRKPKIVEKWQVEAMAMPFMSDAAFNWCIEELQDNTDWNDDSFVLTLDTGSRCAKGDDLISKSVLNDLQSQIVPLLLQSKDWHPDSNEQVLDLIHPSLYPLVYGRTRVKSEGIVKLNEMLVSHKKTTVLSTLTEPPPWVPYPFTGWQAPFGWSWKFQWLPCEVKFEENIGTKVKITSYINNLRPDLHKDLYHTIEQVIGYSIRAWNQVLLRSPYCRTSRRIQQTSLMYEPPPPKWIQGIASHKDDPRWEADLKKVKEYCQLPEEAPPADIDPRHQQWLHDVEMVYQGPGPFSWENGDGTYPVLESVVALKNYRIRKVVHPEPGPDTYHEWKQKQWNAKQWEFKNLKEGEEPNPYPVSLEDEFREQGLQVIVKLASIELTPEKPEYPGGNWHLEGSLSEHIVATAIYYFDVHNVSESRIRFRQAVDRDTYGQVQREGYPGLTDFGEVWGVSSRELEQDAPAIQEIGSIRTSHGRLLAFPNTLQHRVEPFRLVDTTKPGHRRFLVLWLVDPNYRIMSTQNIPPQQPEWQRDQALAILSRKKKPRLPPEVLDIIGEKLVEVASFSLKEAKRYRRALMAERAVLKRNVDSATPSYNLCEH